MTHIHTKLHQEIMISVVFS